MSRERERDANAMLAKNGMTVHEPDAAMRSAFEKVGNQILEEWLKKAGADGQAIIKAYRGK
jgi:TRAP-type C4-dicarboxylate transport system substrate-binding protein